MSSRIESQTFEVEIFQIKWKLSVKVFVTYIDVNIINIYLSVIGKNIECVNQLL